MRTATNDDWRAIVGQEPPAHWIGLVVEENGSVLGFGGAYEERDGRWWACVQTTCRRPVTLWKAAREILETAAAANVPLFALADTQIAGAEAFLRRLGFTETDEIIEGHRVLKWTL